VIIVISPDPRDALRVAGALGLLERHLRANGSRLPDTLRTPVVHAHADSSRPETTTLGGSSGPTDADTVPLLLTYREGATRLGISERSLQRLVAAGAIATKRIGRRAYVRSADLEAFAADKKAA
jgi:excisionase family DNA binding protein